MTLGASGNKYRPGPEVSLGVRECPSVCVCVRAIVSGFDSEFVCQCIECVFSGV